MALGAEPAAQLWQAAVDGDFTLSPEAAHEMAGHYRWFADEMLNRANEIRDQEQVGSFGSLRSARRLQSGFERKAAQAHDAYLTAQESALKMAAAILKAANLSGEVDEANAAAIKAASGKIADVTS